MNTNDNKIIMRLRTTGLLLPMLLLMNYAIHAQCSISYTSVSTPGGGPIVCAGLVNLIATVYGNSASQINWYSPNGLNISGSAVTQIVGGGEGLSSTLQLEVTSSGTYSVSATCGGTEGAKTAVSVSVQTPGILIYISNPLGTDPTNLCDGDVITLQAKNGIGTYNWTSGSGSVNIPNMDHITVTTSDTYIVTGTSSCNTPATGSIPLTFSPRPGALQLSSDGDPICEGSGETTQMTGTITNASIDWAIDGTGNSIGFDGLITWGSSFYGGATVTATAYGCDNTSVKGTYSLYVSPHPVANLSPSGTVTVPLGQDYAQLNVTSTPPGNRYYWHKDGVILSNSTSQLNANHSGTYYVRAVSPAGCYSDTAPAQVTFDSNYNYVIENTLLTDVKSDNTAIGEGDIIGLSATQRAQRIRYFDGAGRPMQDVQTQGSPGQKDIVRPIVYDDAGRQSVSYLPYGTSDTNGWYKTSPVGNGVGDNTYTTSPQYQFYQNTSTLAHDLPYVQTYFEDGAKGRVLKQGAPGAAWQPDSNLAYYSQSDGDKSTKVTYEFNQLNDHVLLFTYDATTGLALANDGTNPTYYPTGGLTCTRVKDEHNKETITYTDDRGRTVCQRKEYGQTGSPPVKQYAETYYLYDVRGNLVIMLPPEAVNSALSSFTQN